MASFNGQDAQVESLADANNVYICKRRDTYMYCTFLSAGDRTAFKTALGGVQNVSFADHPMPTRPNYYVVKVVPT